MGLSVGGLASGLDVSGMTKQLVSAERAPKEQRITEQLSKVDVSLSAYGQVKSSITSLEDMMKKFAEDKVFSSHDASSSETSYVGVTAEPEAKTGSYSIEVKQLAQTNKLATVNSFDADPEATLGSGDLVISVGSDSMTVNIDSQNSSLKDIVNAINKADDNPGVTATIITDDAGAKIVFSSNETGKDQAIKIDASGATGDLAKLSYDPSAPAANAEMKEMQPGKDAEIKIDGFATVTSSTNKFENAIEGVTLDVKKLTGTYGTSAPETDDIEVKAVTIEITNDTKQAKSSIEGFVEAYNGFIDMTDSLSKYDVEKQKGGPLVGDSLTRSIIGQMRNLLNTPIEVDGVSYQMADFGVTTDRYGKVEIDDELLDEAVKENFAAFEAFFATDEVGFLDKAEKLFKGYSDSDGTLTIKENSLKEQQDRLNDDMEKLNTQMKAYEERMYKQFSAMDAAIGKMNQELNTMLSLLTF